VSKGQKVTKTG